MAPPRNPLDDLALRSRLAGNGYQQRQKRAAQDAILSGARSMFRGVSPETLATFASSALAGPLAGTAGLATLPFQGSEGASHVIDRVQQALTYQPRGERAQGELRAAGEALAPLEKALKVPGDVAFGATGMPMMGMFGTLAAEAALNAAVPGARGRRALQEAADAAARGPRELGSFDLPVDVPFGETSPGASTATRVPGTKNPAVELTHDLTIDPQEYVNLPGRSGAPVSERLAEVLPNYPGMNRRIRNPDRALEEFTESRVENLQAVHDMIDPALRERMTHWYPGAHRIALDRSRRYGVPIEGTAGAYAALSPQMDWFKNVSLGDRVMDISLNPANQGWTSQMAAFLPEFAGNAGPVMRPRLEALRGKSYEQLDNLIDRALWVRLRDEAMNPREYRIVTPEGELTDLMRTAAGDPMQVGWGNTREIAKALAMLENPTIQTVSQALGDAHKVRNFYHNIANPFSPRGEATIDTHAVAAGEFSPLGGSAFQVLQNFGGGAPASSPGFQPYMAGAGLSRPAHGYQGTYPLHLGILQQAAETRGLLPREMQSITWEGIRNLFTNKSPAVKARVRSIWDDVSAGRLDPGTARDLIVEEAGGISTPAWAR